jgi:DNA (cytosine-5)-methyltransferase 1
MILDLFAGPGGWDQGLRMLGRTDVLGLELDHIACRTARANGHARLCTDVAAFDPASIAEPVEGLIASPPCQGFSMAGKGKGRGDSAALVDAAQAMGAGVRRDSLAEQMLDYRSILALEPLRYALTLKPEWLAWEQVPAVLPLWEACAAVLRGLGFSAWTGLLRAEQYGVPQTRKRAVLIASRLHAVGAPVATHSKYYERDPRRLDAGVQPWVSMADALGWGMTARPSMTVTAGGTATGGAEPFGNAARQGMLRELEAGRWVLRSPQSIAGGGRAIRVEDQPAVTVTGHFDRALWQFAGAGRTAIATAGQKRRELGEPAHTITGKGTAWWVGADRRVTPEEAAALQSFRAYVFIGNKGQQFRQIGDAVPPLLAAHCLAAAGAGTFATEERAA